VVTRNRSSIVASSTLRVGGRGRRLDKATRDGGRGGRGADGGGKAPRESVCWSTHDNLFLNFFR
jgi:hypothetical protein